MASNTRRARPSRPSPSRARDGGGAPVEAAVAKRSPGAGWGPCSAVCPAQLDMPMQSLVPMCLGTALTIRNASRRIGGMTDEHEYFRTDKTTLWRDPRQRSMVCTSFALLSRSTVQLPDPAVATTLRTLDKRLRRFQQRLGTLSRLEREHRRSRVASAAPPPRCRGAPPLAPESSARFVVRSTSADCVRCRQR